MKALMGYGLNEGKKNTPFASVEYMKEASDGNVYGIIREGAKFYIKVAPKKAEVLREDFQYIGGFRNRKDNEYSSFANAQKQFDLKMMSIKEAYSNGKNIVIESWNPDKKEELTIESTDKMRREILRERQIMRNATLISEKKECSASDPFCVDVTPKTMKDTEGNDDPEKNNQKDEFDPEMTHEEPKKGQKLEPKAEKMNEAEVLGWNDNKDYLDTSHGTEVGDSAPFDKGLNSDDEAENGVVEEEVITSPDNQNDPTVGVGEVGDSDPFTEKPSKIEEAAPAPQSGMPVQAQATDANGDGMPDAQAVDMNGDGMADPAMGATPMDAAGMAGEEAIAPEGDVDPADPDDDDDEDDDDIEARLENLEDIQSDIDKVLTKIANKLGIDGFEIDDEAYEDDKDLYDDEEEEEEDGEDLDDEAYDGEEEMYDDADDEDVSGMYGTGEEEEEEEIVPESYQRRNRIIESAGYRREMARRRRMNEDKLDYFGKHPAYQKTVMELPTNEFNEFDGYYDMNDDSVKNTSPYGQQIGDGAPFEIDVEQLENAITEQIQRILKKKI